MLTKKNLWFLTLFSIIIVMTVYYISIPTPNETMVSKEVSTEGTNAEVEESNLISALRIDREESLENEVKAIKEILVDEAKTTEEKSDAYEALKELNLNKGKEEAIEASIKENFNYNSFVKVDGANVKVVVESDKHSYELANKIINEVQKSYDKKVYVTVSFGSM